MTRRRKDPLRTLTHDERRHLTRLRRSSTASVVHFTRATVLLAVAAGADYLTAAQTAGRKSGDAVSHLVARFNREGLAALDLQHAGGRVPTYDTAARDRILREASRPPTPQADGTATWSLTTLQRTLRLEPGRIAEGLDVYHLAGAPRSGLHLPTDSHVVSDRLGHSQSQGRRGHCHRSGCQSQKS